MDETKRLIVGGEGTDKRRGGQCRSSYSDYHLHLGSSNNCFGASYVSVWQVFMQQYISQHSPLNDGTLKQTNLTNPLV